MNSYRNLILCFGFTWMSCSFGLPVFASLYINVIDEFGSIYLIKENIKIDNFNHGFEKCLRDSYIYPVNVLYGVLSIPLSICYMFESTLYFCDYCYNYKNIQKKYIM